MHVNTSPEIVSPDGDSHLSVLGVTPSMRRVAAFIQQIARLDVPVFCTGESGTGKEVVTKLIHHHSARKARPLVKVNCAALPFDLLESELFGYEQGAFTGALRSKPGKFEIANGGTLFLDEIGEMAPTLQAKLLHVLQDGEFTRLGGRTKTCVNVRVIAATNVDLVEAMASGALRRDLYYRLSSFKVNLPPLRERRQDIPLLFERFLNNYASQFNLPVPAVSRELLAFLDDYDWPGNVRELENVVKRYIVFPDEHSLILELAETRNLRQMLSSPSARSEERNDLKTRLRDVKQETEERAIRQMLHDTNWNRKEAARRLNISYKALLYKVRQYGFEQRSSTGGSGAAQGLARAVGAGD